MIDHGVGFRVHDPTYAIIGSSSQLETSDIRDCDNRRSVANGAMTVRGKLRPEAAEVFEKLEALDLKQRDLAVALGIEENKVSKIKSGERQFRGTELIKALRWLSDIEERGGYVERPDLPDADPQRDYLPVEVLPSFGGMGGGGSGEGDIETGLVPRRLVEDELRAKPSDLLLIEARGSSMEPDFLHGDQILIDKRDTNPVQPGSFALWDGDGYVVKLVERVPQQPGRYRIFSANTRYSASEVDAEQVTIMGRPVWFGRRL